ncbi:MAG: ABC transporter permease [Kiritimatiellae bacterium]|nr:ABC transporter permease [Kiritimatiellia bacterium]
MPKGSTPYRSRFDLLLAGPLAAYLLLLIALIAGVFGRITPEALAQAFRDSALLHAVWLSLLTSVFSTLLAVLVAVPSGYLLARRRFPGHFVLDTLLDLPIVLPPLVMGLAVLIFFNTALGRWLDRGVVKQGLFVYQPLGIVLVQFIVGCAFAVRVIKAGFDGLDLRYEEVAMTLGANRAQTFFKIVLPNVAPSLVAGAVISWARIFGLFGPVLLVCGTMRGRTEIMPTTIFLEVSIGRIEVALVVGACMILISMATLVAFKRLGGKGYLW